MTARRPTVILLMLVGGGLTAAAPALALPTMIRLGYTDCSGCHLSPQGGGPLNEYGRGIDQAQSLRGGEYKPSSDPESAGALRGRITQDLRTVLQRQDTFASGRQTASLFRPRLMYRNVTTLTDGIRLAGTVTFEAEHVPRPALSYDPAARPTAAFVNTALLHYRVTPTVELAAGRDQLPTGVNMPDLSLFVRARNGLGYYDAPWQTKAFWNAKRFHVTPFAYRDSGNEQAPERESGIGTLAEVDLFGRQNTMVGVNLVRGSSVNGRRNVVGAYARLGFGPWGLLAEHDVTSRQRDETSLQSFQQRATFAQVFWAAREWLVASAIGERLTVDQPFPERLIAGRLELTARLASQATIGVSARIQRDGIAGRYTRSIAVQAALKTVQ